MPEAINLTFGDYILLEIALVSYMKDMDLSMQCGHAISELLGKLEYQMTRIREELATARPIDPPPAAGLDKPGT